MGSPNYFRFDNYSTHIQHIREGFPTDSTKIRHRYDKGSTYSTKFRHIRQRCDKDPTHVFLLSKKASQKIFHIKKSYEHFKVQLQQSCSQPQAGTASKSGSATAPRSSARKTWRTHLTPCRRVVLSLSMCFATPGASQQVKPSQITGTSC